MKDKFIKVITLCSLIFIIIIQIFWIVNMYKTNNENLKVAVEKSLDDAVLSEYAFRSEMSGGFSSFSAFTRSSADTARFLTKTIRGVDTSFVVTIDKYDGRSLQKIVQFLLKHDDPINVSYVDSIFKASLQRIYPTIKNTYVDYIDLGTGEVKNSSSNGQGRSFLQSKLYVLDISNTIAIKAYVENPFFILFKEMITLLILSIILISLSFYSIFYLLRSYLTERKEAEMRRDAIKTMTHEFKRPISSAVAQIALIPYYLKKENPDKASRYAESTLLELNKLTAYTERIQSISKGTESSLTLNKTSVYLLDFFKSTQKKYAQVSEKKIELKLEVNTELEYIQMDLLHMSNVLDNLIENAIKYSKDDLKIVINAQDENGNLLIQVKDNGIGIAKNEVSKVFDRYFRSSNLQSTNTNGFGLGLTYCKLVVEEHGGTISVESELEQGSTFSVWLPAT